MFALLILLALSWPVLAAAAAASIGWGAWRRSGWPLTAGAALASLAAYGFGLARTTTLLMTDADDACAIATRGHAFSAGGASSLWPLHDTTCGPELVPAFVTPLVVLSAALCSVLLTLTIAARVFRPRSP